MIVSRIVAPAQLQVFPDAVENDNRVIHRITHQRQQRRNHRQVDFAVEKRKQPQSHQRVVKHRKNSGCAINPLKAKCDIDQHSTQRIQRGEYCLALQIIPDFRSDRGRTQNLELPRKSLVQSINNDGAAGAGVLGFRPLKLDDDVIASRLLPAAGCPARRSP